MNNKTRLLVQYTICLGAFLSNLSAGMFNIALVDIARTFDSSIPHAQWIVTAYLLVISVLLPVMGKLGDMLGRRNIHNIGYFIFMGGALCCALSPSLNALVSSRIIQASAPPCIRQLIWRLSSPCSRRNNAGRRWD